MEILNKELLKYYTESLKAKIKSEINVPSITVDTALSSTSTNPVLNKVINSALANKVNTNDSRLSDARKANGGTADSATKATLDGNGNNIVDTYVTKSELTKNYGDGLKAEIVTLHFNRTSGTGSLTKATITVKTAGSTVYTFTYSGTDISFLATPGLTYAITISDPSYQEGYDGTITTTIDNFVALNGNSRNLTVNYSTISLGVAIETTDGHYYTLEQYPGGTYSNNNKVNSIVLSTSDKTYRILPTISDYILWSSENPKQLISKTMTRDSTTAKADMDGKGNTTQLLSWGKATAANYANSCTFRDGGHGYLPSLGELMVLQQNASDLNKAFLKLNGNSNRYFYEIGSDGSYWYWSSTQYDASVAWGLRNGGNAGGYSWSNGYGRVLVLEA